MRRRRSRHYEHLPQDFRSPAQPEQQEQATATVQHPVLQMQRQFGNQAVGQQMHRIQRQQDFLLGGGVPTRDFTAPIRDWVISNPTATAIQLLAQMILDVQAHLVSLGIPKPEYAGGADIPASLEGRFNNETWHILINPKLAGDPNRAVSTLTMEERQHMVAVVYHEARHCEQYYKMGQFLARSGVPAADIATQLKIPTTVAQTAFENPLPGISQFLALGEGRTISTVAEEYMEIKSWYETIAGKYATYTQAIYDILQNQWRFANFATALLKADTPETRGELDNIIANWRDKTVAVDLKGTQTRLSQSLFQFTNEQTILGHIGTILPRMESAIAAWNKEGTAAEIRDFATNHIRTLGDVVKPAYEDILTERDAHHIGDKAADTYKFLTEG
jgi:hypothetical protein